MCCSVNRDRQFRYIRKLQSHLTALNIWTEFLFNVLRNVMKSVSLFMAADRKMKIKFIQDSYLPYSLRNRGVATHSYWISQKHRGQSSAEHRVGTLWR